MSRIPLSRASGSARKQTIAIYHCHCEAFRAHLEMRKLASSEQLELGVKLREDDNKKRYYHQRRKALFPFGFGKFDTVYTYP